MGNANNTSHKYSSNNPYASTRSQSGSNSETYTNTPTSPSLTRQYTSTDATSPICLDDSPQGSPERSFTRQSSQTFPYSTAMSRTGSEFYQTTDSAHLSQTVQSPAHHSYQTAEARQLSKTQQAAQGSHNPEGNTYGDAVINDKGITIRGNAWSAHNPAHLMKDHTYGKLIVNDDGLVFDGDLPEHVLDALLKGKLEHKN